MKRYVSKFEESKYPSLRIPLISEPHVYTLHMYHVTSLDNLKEIFLSRGLIPGRSIPIGQNWLGTWSGKAIYFHLSFPKHEMKMSYDEETGDPFTCVLEFNNYKIGGNYIVPDEDSTLDLSKTKEVIQNKEPIAIGYIIPTTYLKNIYVIDTLRAREIIKQYIPRSHWNKIIFYKI